MSSEPRPQFDRQQPAFRIIDANSNRAAEGLRVIEDFCRFVLADRYLNKLCKQLRHDLREILSGVGSQYLLSARDTLADVGTQVAASDEYQRQDVLEIAVASQKRVEQSLRCIEEYLKPDFPELAADVEQLRYRAYSLGRAVWQTSSSTTRLEDTQLYVLLDATPSSEKCVTLCSQLLEAGVRMFQLRDKQLDDRSLLALARRLREVTSRHGAKLIVNDRPDIARLAMADGVHVGQAEIEVRDVKSLLGPNQIIGVSTHSIEQAQQAVLDGASYLGCGPTFQSSTKQFDHFPGIDFLKQVAGNIRLPAFAIGGIAAENIAEVANAGFTRVAIANGITRAENPVAVAEAIQQTLRAVPARTARK